jgi:hypothetical protein
MSEFYMELYVKLLTLRTKVWCYTLLYYTYIIAFGFPNHEILQDKFLLHTQKH